MNRQPNVSNPSTPTNYLGPQSAVLPETVRVLVAEDNEINLLIMVAMLRKWDKTQLLIHSAANGKEVIAMVQRQDYDIILMDCQMPMMDGYQATRHIRQQLESPKRDIPIIAVTAAITAPKGEVSDEEKRVYASGMNSFVSKPFEPSHLFEKMINVLTPTPTLMETLPPIRKQAKPLKTYDLSFLRSVTGGDNPMLLNRISRFLNTMPFELSDMQESINSLQFSQMAAIAHRIRANARSLGILGVLPLLELMEHKGKTMHETLVQEEMICHFWTIQSVFDRAMTELGEELPLIEQLVMEKELQAV